MPIDVKIPSDYKPFKTLIVCSNKLINGRVPFEVNGFVPFLVGVGENVPLIWVQVPSNKNLDSWQYLVRANRSLHSNTQIIYIKKGIKVQIGNRPIIHVVSESNESAEILDLDLRPMGLQIFGTKDMMTVGNQIMKNNVFENVDAMMGVGVKDPR